MCPINTNGELLAIKNEDIPADGQFVVPTGVKAIGDTAFKGCTSLRAVIIPEGVTRIGSDAFANCGNLSAVSMPDSVTTIDSGAFFGCSSLRAVIIPDGVTSIASEAFAACRSLIAVKIPDAVTTIGFAAFYKCCSLSDVIIPDDVTTIANHAFEACISLSRVSIPDGVTSIGAYAFSECQNLSAVNIPDSVTTIGYHAFERCIRLSAVKIPAHVTMIHHAAFASCTSLRSVTIPDSVSAIDGRAFFGCSSLSAVILPDGMTTIHQDTFSGCRSLSRVSIPESVTEIEPNAFDNCTHLSAIMIDSDDTNHLEKICKMLPDDLQALIVNRAMYAEILKAQEAAMHAMRAEPTLGSLPGLRSRLSSDPQTIIASYEENSAYAQIQQKLLAHPIPRDATALTIYKNDLCNIVEKEIYSHKRQLCITRLAQYLSIARETIGKTHPAAADKADAPQLGSNMKNLQRLEIVEGIIERLKRDQELSLSDAQKELLQGGMLSKILEAHDIDLALNPQDPHSNQPAPKF